MLSRSLLDRQKMAPAVYDAGAKDQHLVGDIRTRPSGGGGAVNRCKDALAEEERQSPIECRPSRRVRRIGACQSAESEVVSIEQRGGILDAEVDRYRRTHVGSLVLCRQIVGRRSRAIPLLVGTGASGNAGVGKEVSVRARVHKSRYRVSIVGSGEISGVAAAIRHSIDVHTAQDV